MMTDKDNWQEKPGEGENAARRDGERNQENSGNEANPWRKPADSRSSQGSYDRTRKHNSDTKGGFNRGGNSFDRSRRSFGDDNNRPPRSGNSDGNSFNNNFSRPRPFAEGDNERPRRPFGDAGNDRPRSSFGDSGNRFGASSRDGNSLDRPKRNYNDSNYSRPSRPFGQSEGDRPRRPFSEGNNDRPQRSYGDTGNRFGPSNQEGGFAKPRRTFGESESERPRRPFSEGSNDRPRRSFGDNGNRFGSTDRDGNSFDRPRRPFTEGGSDRPRHTVGDGTFKPSFNGPSLPKPDRSDGRPRRPRIKLESRFDHGTPSNRPTGGFQQPLDPNVPLRLNKFLANAGICSRREADEFIQAGVVKVNGETVTELGVKVKPIDTILFHDQQVSIERKVYILLNKPKDCVTTSDDPQERLTVMDLVKGACFERIYPVGRLDRNTTGVLLLTNDGDLASKLTHPKFEKRKIYQVTLDRNLTEADFTTILAGVTLDEEAINVDNLSYVDPDKLNVVGIEIHSGQNRVVRRIFESLNYKVFKLDRVYFAGLTKKNLPRGKWRHLSEKEVNLLKMGAFV